MSEYTTQVRYICEFYAGLETDADYKATPAVIEKARPKIFDFDYPIYDSAYKPILERKIINHYYFREIGSETVAQFKFMLARTLNEIMPYYNGLYKSADMDFNPFYDVDYYRTHEGSDAETRTNSRSEKEVSSSEETSGSVDATNYTEQFSSEGSDSTNSTQSTTTENTFNTTDTLTHNTTETVRESDTPQGGLTGIENNNYLSRAEIRSKSGTESTAHTGTDTTESEQAGEVTGERQSSGSEESTTERNTSASKTGSGESSMSGSGQEDKSGTDRYLDHIYGKQGGATYSALLKEYRETLVNIDMMIINELEICFMNIY